MTTPSLSLSNISKRFPGVQALNDVSLNFEAGEIHAVLGENGSGKSTLLGIASGALAVDLGTIEILGQPLTSAVPSLARKLGLATVYQDNSLVLELTVAQNLHLGTVETSAPYTKMKARARRLLEEYNLLLDPDAAVADISPAHRQFLEIIKALSSSPKVLLLDEPTTALDLHDVDTLHTIIRRIAAAKNWIEPSGWADPSGRSGRGTHPVSWEHQISTCRRRRRPGREVGSIPRSFRSP